MIKEDGEKPSSYKRKILWVQPKSRDKALHKMAELEVLRKLAHNYKIYLITTSQKKMPLGFVNSKICFNLIPLKAFPFVLPIIRTLVLLMLLPIYTALRKPEFIITTPDLSILSFIPILVFSKLKKAKIVLDIRSIPVETSGLRGFMFSFWFTVSILIAKRFFNGLTIITSPMKQEICAKFHINPEKVGVWTSGVSTELFDPSKYTSEKSDLRKKLGLSGKFVIFYHGVFTETRGLKETLQAIKLVKNKLPDAFLFLLGRGPISSSLKNMVRDEDLQDNVAIHDAVDQKEVPTYISVCDIGIVPLPNHPYWRNQSPLKLLEYLAMEKVVIVTDIPAHKSIIGEEKCGFYVSSTKPIEIAKTIEQAYYNKKKLEGWGKIGREIVKKKYTWEKVANDLGEYLLSLY